MEKELKVAAAATKTETKTSSRVGSRPMARPKLQDQEPGREPTFASGQQASSPQSSQVDRVDRPDRVDLHAAARAIEDFLTALGHPPQSDPQLHETGMLVARAFHQELLSGYASDPKDILRESIAASSGDMILVRDLPITSMCPHHLLPSTGVLHLGYLPGERIVGFGALERLAHALSRRLVLQEALCEQVAQALTRELGARGAGCIAELEPMCLNARGQRPSHAKVVTTSFSGALREDADLRRELFAMLQRSEGSSSWRA